MEGVRFSLIVRYQHMRTWTRIAAVSGLMLMVVGGVVGCELKREKIPSVQMYGPEVPAGMSSAPEDGDYVLYKGDAKEPMARTYLKAGTPIGFKRGATDQDGKPVGGANALSAVAGELVVPVAVGDMYEWKLIPKTSDKLKRENPYYPRP